MNISVIGTGYVGLPVGVGLAKHGHQKPPSPRQVNPDLSPALERIILRALDKSSETRFASAHDMIDALEQTTRPPA